MRCEVIAIGSELLLGQIVDTNSSWIGEQLAMFASIRIFKLRSTSISTVWSSASARPWTAVTR